MQLVEQDPGLFQVARVKAQGEPAVDGREAVMGRSARILDGPALRRAFGVRTSSDGLCGGANAARYATSSNKALVFLRQNPLGIGVGGAFRDGHRRFSASGLGFGSQTASQ
jgi:hypothetical protein